MPVQTLSRNLLPEPRSFGGLFCLHWEDSIPVPPKPVRTVFHNDGHFRFSSPSTQIRRIGTRQSHLMARRKHVSVTVAWLNRNARNSRAVTVFDIVDSAPNSYVVNWQETIIRQ